MFGSKDSTEAAQQDDRQATLFPPDPAYVRHEDSLQLRHYLMGGVLVAAMLGVLVTGYYYSRSLVIQEPKEEVTAPSAPTPATPPAQPAAPAPAKKIEIPAQPKPTEEKSAAKPASAMKKNIQAPKPEIPPKEKSAAKPTAVTTVYFVQVAAFKDPRETARLCKQIEPLGFSCYFGSVDQPDGRYWRLRVGPYETKAQAEGALAKLQGKDFDGRLIPLKKSGVKAPVQLPL